MATIKSFKTDVSSVSPSWSRNIRSDEGLTPETSVLKLLTQMGVQNYPVILFYRSSTTASSQTSAPENLFMDPMFWVRNAGHGQWSPCQLIKFMRTTQWKERKKKSSFCTVLGTFKKSESSWAKRQNCVCFLTNSSQDVHRYPPTDEEMIAFETQFTFINF